MTQIRPNLKGRFLSPSLTHANHQGDICLGKGNTERSEYSNVFEYFWPNIRYSNTNIKKLEYEYIRIFGPLKSWGTNVFEYS